MISIKAAKERNKKKFNQTKFIIRHAFVSLAVSLASVSYTKKHIFIYSMHDKLQIKEFRGIKIDLIIPMMEKCEPMKRERKRRN